MGEASEGCDLLPSQTGSDEGGNRLLTVVDPVPSVSWAFRVSGGVDEAWAWEERGAPALGLLSPVRKPRSSERNRHVPVTAYSMTNSGHVALESGLEHDLLRKIDRDPSVVRIATQPFRLSWTDPVAGAHTPDLLAMAADGGITVWDVRAADHQDEDFQAKAAITARACEGVGWAYRVFPGLGDVERLNLLWLHGFRRTPEWSERFANDIQSAVGTHATTLGELFRLGDDTGELRSVVWHLIWSGCLTVDLTAPLTERSFVGLAAGSAHA